MVLSLSEAVLSLAADVVVNAEEAVRRQLGIILGEGMGRGIGAAGGVDDAVPAGTVSLDIDYIFHVQQRGVTVTFVTGAAAGTGGAAVQNSSTCRTRRGSKGLRM